MFGSRRVDGPGVDLRAVAGDALDEVDARREPGEDEVGVQIIDARVRAEPQRLVGERRKASFVRGGFSSWRASGSKPTAISGAPARTRA